MGAIKIMAALAGIFGVAAFAGMSFIPYGAARITNRVRNVYISAVLGQEMAFFDESKPGEVVAALAEYTMDLEEGISIKLGEALQATLGGLGGFVVALYLLQLADHANVPRGRPCDGLFILLDFAVGRRQRRRPREGGLRGRCQRRRRDAVQHADRRQLRWRVQGGGEVREPPRQGGGGGDPTGGFPFDSTIVRRSCAVSAQEFNDRFFPLSLPRRARLSGWARVFCGDPSSA